MVAQRGRRRTCVCVCVCNIPGNRGLSSALLFARLMGTTVIAMTIIASHI